MTYEQIIDKIKNKAYQNTDPYPSGGDINSLREARHIWNAKDNEKMQVFWSDLKEYFKPSVVNHPYYFKVTAKAWEHGHANGLREVFYWAREFAELLET